MKWQIIAGIIPGILIFIYGMGHLSHEIQQVVGRRFKKLLARMTKNPVYGVILGTGATSLLQSSSATTLIAVSLVNAGVLTLEQSLGVIFGANIGTTITSQLVAFKLTVYAPIFLALGFFISIFGRHYKFLGKAIFYFGLVFFALHLVGQAVDPIRDDPMVIDFLANLKSPLIGIVVGFILTVLVQSSSVISGVAVLLGVQGLIGPATAIPIILGANVGTTTTTVLASVGMEPAARRSAFAHMLFNLAGVLIALPLLPFLLKLLAWLGGGVGQQIANGHLIFNIGAAIIFLILIKPFAAVIRWLVPSDGEEVVTGAVHIHLDKVPKAPDAVRLLEKEVAHQVSLVKLLFQSAVQAVKEGDLRKIKRTESLEAAIDDLDSEIMEYMLVLSKRRMARKDARTLAILVNVANALENLGDSGRRISESAGKLYEHGMAIGKGADLVLEELCQKLDNALSEVEVALNAGRKPDLRQLARIRQEADRIVARMQVAYLREIKREHLTPYSGPLFGDALANMEHANHVAYRIGLMLSGKASDTTRDGTVMKKAVLKKAKKHLSKY